MENSNSTDHDEDVTANIMMTLSAALLMNPRFNFSKLMDLSADINGEKNKETLCDIIALAFLTYLDMGDAASLLSEQNIAASAGFLALNLDKNEALSWFIRFMAVMNPGIIATMSQTLLNVVNGLMIQNTRSSDGDRLRIVKNKVDRFVESGEMSKRSERLIEEKPTTERSKRKESVNLGFIGWAAGKSHRRASKSSSATSSNSRTDLKASSLKKKNKPKSKRIESGRSHEDETTATVTKLSDYLDDLSIANDDIRPDESASNVTKESVDHAPLLSSNLKSLKNGKGKQVRIRSDDSLVSG